MLTLLKRRFLNQAAYFISRLKLVRVLARLPKGAVVLDCGANKGDITLLFAKKGAIVHSFEPDPLAFQMLLKRTQHFPNVKCYQKGVSNQNGRVKMFFHHGRTEREDIAFSVSSSIVSEKINVNTNNYHEIEIISLSDFIKSLEQRVYILKMDVEGAELDILEDLIENKVYEKIDLLLVETHEKKIPSHVERLKRLKNIISQNNINNIKLNWI